MEERVKEIYGNLEQAIATENEEETEKLVKLLAKEKGMTEAIIMPKDFVKQIRRKEGTKCMAGKGRLLKVAMAGLAAVCAIGGTAYAATHWGVNDVHFTDSGIVAVENEKKDSEIEFSEDSDGNTVISDYGKDGSVVAKTEIMTGENAKDKDTKENTGFTRDGNLEESVVRVLEEQNGTKDTNWSHKVTKLETTPTYRSDDGKKWEKDEMSKYQFTDYTYDTWDKLYADDVMPNVFSEKTFEGFCLDAFKIVYQEGHMEAKEKITYKSLRATYLKKKKKIELELGMDELNKGDAACSIVISSEDGKSENQRFYTTEDNVKYALEDVKRNGGKSTFAYLSGNGSSIYIFFTNMTEKEIEYVLDHIDPTVLLEHAEK